MPKTKTETRTTNVTVACDPEMIAEIDQAIRKLNTKLPEMAKINRARFVRGCVQHILTNPGLLLKQ